MMRNNFNWNINKHKPLRPWNQKKQNYNFLKNKIDFKHNFYLPIILSFLFLRKLGINFRRYPDQFGHQNFDVEYFLREEKNKSGINIFILGKTIPNRFLFKKHIRLITIIRVPNWLLKQLLSIDKISKVKFGKSIFNVVEYVYKKIDIIKKNWSDQNSKIIFTKREREIGEDILKNLGLEKYSYVTFTSRSKNFYINNNKSLFEFRNGKNAESKIIQHENELAQLYRNSDFLKYKTSIKFLNKQGYKSVRFGAGEKEIKLNEEGFVDFAGKYREKLGYNGHFLDIFLLHYSYFFVGGGTGANAAIVTTQRPALAVNAFPWPWLCFPPRSIDMYIPKIYTHSDGQLVHFCDLLKLSTLIDWRTFYDGGMFFRENKNLSVIDNSSSEILAAVKEMLTRVNLNFKDNDIHLRNNFNKIIKPNHEIFYSKSKISLSFIQKYHHLIK